MKKTKEEAKQTRQALLESALTLFDENGYENTTLSQIAKNAQVTRGAFYHHFDNKEDLLKQLAEDCYSTHIARTQEILSQNHSWRQYATQVTEAISELNTNPDVLKFLRITERQRHLDMQPSAVAALLTYYDNLCDAQLHQVIEQAIAQSDIPKNTNIELAFLHLRCILTGMVKIFIDCSDGIKASQIKWLIDQSFDSIALGAFCD